MARFELGNVSNDIISIAKNKNVAQIYLKRDGSVFRIYYFVNDLNTEILPLVMESRGLDKKFSDFKFDPQILPYTKNAVEQYAMNHDLTPVYA